MYWHFDNKDELIADRSPTASHGLALRPLDPVGRRSTPRGDPVDPLLRTSSRPVFLPRPRPARLLADGPVPRLETGPAVGPRRASGSSRPWRGLARLVDVVVAALGPSKAGDRSRPARAAPWRGYDGRPGRPVPSPPVRPGRGPRLRPSSCSPSAWTRSPWGLVAGTAVTHGGRAPAAPPTPRQRTPRQPAPAAPGGGRGGRRERRRRAPPSPASATRGAARELALLALQGQGRPARGGRRAFVPGVERRPAAVAARRGRSDWATSCASTSQRASGAWTDRPVFMRLGHLLLLLRREDPPAARAGFVDVRRQARTASRTGSPRRPASRTRPAPGVARAHRPVRRPVLLQPARRPHWTLRRRWTRCSTRRPPVAPALCDGTA